MAHRFDASISTTDVQPHQRASFIVRNLTGIAKEYAVSFAPQQLVERRRGYKDNQVDAVTFLLIKLREKFGPLEEETRLNSLIEFAGIPAITLEKVLSKCWFPMPSLIKPQRSVKHRPHSPLKDSAAILRNCYIPNHQTSRSSPDLVVAGYLQQTSIRTSSHTPPTLE
jgi:hypothetical protein